MTSFDLSFDYRCPFAKNIHLHVIAALRAGADFDVNFAPWSLSQGSRAEGAPDVWNDPAYDGDRLSLPAADARPPPATCFHSPARSRSQPPRDGPPGPVPKRCSGPVPTARFASSP